MASLRNRCVEAGTLNDWTGASDHGTESQQPYSCAAILPEGATLAVWSPCELNEGQPSVKLTGNA